MYQRFLIGAACFATLTAGSCAREEHVAAVSEKPVPYAVGVDAGCIGDKGRPQRPVPLNRRYTADQWAALPDGAAASAVAAQGGARLSFEEEDAAATVSCH